MVVQLRNASAAALELGSDQLDPITSCLTKWGPLIPFPNAEKHSPGVINFPLHNPYLSSFFPNISFRG